MIARMTVFELQRQRSATSPGLSSCSLPAVWLSFGITR
jgi:hypothetical protein